MARHRAPARTASRWTAPGQTAPRRRRATLRRIVLRRILPALVVVGLVAGIAVLALPGPGVSSRLVGASGCGTELRVVTASSFAPVLAAVAPAVADGPDCARLDVVVADGRGAAPRALDDAADVWIPDDTSWAAAPGRLRLAEGPQAAAGTVLALSPLFLVTDDGTARRIADAGGGWLGLTGLVTGQPADDGPPVRIVARDPAGSGDGLLAAGALGEAVWLDAGMDASAEALAAALPSFRTPPDAGPPLPREPGEVGLVPEHALLPALRTGGADGRRVVAPSDHTAALRYTWQPTAEAAADPATARALARLHAVLTGPDAAAPLSDAGLRGGDATVAPGPPVPGLPPVAAPLFDVLGPHHVDHVFATWYPDDRRSDVLVAVDVSGSMAARAEGTDRPLIDLVKEGFADLGTLLPDSSELGLWEFGVRLAPPDDHRVLLPRGVLTGDHRARVGSAVQALRARDTGTGLHDTVLAAYTAARDRHRTGVPNHVVVFTDGRNEADPGSLTPEQLSAQLTAAKDDARPVLLTVVAFGDKPEAAALEAALAPVDGYVDRLSGADEVGAVFIHVAAGGLHH